MGVAPLDDAVEIEHGSSGMVSGRGEWRPQHCLIGARHQWRPLILQAFFARPIMATLRPVFGQDLGSPLK
jgi:hypothetical protein